MGIISKRECIKILIDKLKENNVFEQYMSINDIEKKLDSIVKEVIVEDLSAHGTNGEWNFGNLCLYLDEKKILENGLTKKLKRTISHELLHALTTRVINAKNVRCGLYSYSLNNSKVVYSGRGLNEGTTEYFISKFYPNYYIETYTYSDKVNLLTDITNYSLEQVVVKQIAALYGEDKIIKAYLNNSDIEMPREQYMNIRENMDFITEKRTRNAHILKGREISELSKVEQIKVNMNYDVIEDVFIKNQEYFLEQCLNPEINKINTKQQAEELKSKLKELNSFNINIEGNENANYEKYNFRFIRKYLQIVNKDRSENKKVSFDEVEEYLKSNNSLDVRKESLFNKIVGHFIKMKEGIKLQLSEKKSVFIPIDRGNEGIIYIRECGSEKIAGKKVAKYQYLTSEEYMEFKNSGRQYTGEILRGNIDLKKVAKDKKYASVLAHKVLSESWIKDKLLNCNGYVGHVSSGWACIYEEVRKRMQEEYSFVPFKLAGFNKELYIIQEKSIDHCDLTDYTIVNREEVEKYRNGENNLGIKIKENIDLYRFTHDNIYRSFVENNLLTKNIVSKKNMYFGMCDKGINTNNKGLSYKMGDNLKDDSTNNIKTARCNLDR